VGFGPAVKHGLSPMRRPLLAVQGRLQSLLYKPLPDAANRVRINPQGFADLGIRPRQAARPLIHLQQHPPMQSLPGRRFAHTHRALQRAPLLTCQMNHILIIHTRSHYLASSWPYAKKKIGLPLQLTALKLTDY
jgi:hypothetical protein